MSGTATAGGVPVASPTSDASMKVGGHSSSWPWFLAMGIALVIVGTLAIGASLITTLATVFAFGILLLIGAATQLIGALRARHWSGFFIELLTGVFYLIIGLLMLGHPIGAAAGLTLMIAAFLLVGGTFRIAVALSERFESWPWVALSGGVSIMLGVFIWRQWPVSGLWVIGLFVGIEMIFSGWSWIMLGMCARKLQCKVCA